MPDRVRVLHADDDAELLELSRRVLDRQGSGGLTTTTAGTAEAALDALHEGADCLVSDSMTLPDGQTLVGAARRDFPDLRIVMFTGHDRPASAGDADAVVEKGEGFGALRDAVEATAADRSAGGPTTVARHDWASGEEFVSTLVPAVAAYLDRPVETMPVLYDAVDGEALGRLLRSAAAEANLRVQFRYCGLDVVATGDGVVTVTDGPGGD